MSLKLENKVAVVTGGSTGIGLAIAKRFVSEGAKVYITGRRQPELDAAVQAIGGGAEYARVDSADITQLQTLFDRIKQKHGKLDILVANAGGGSLMPFGQITEEHFDDTFSRNVKGTLFTVQTALPLLGQGSSVILTGPGCVSKNETLAGSARLKSAARPATRRSGRGFRQTRRR